MFDIVERMQCIHYRIVEIIDNRMTILCLKQDYVIIEQILKENGYFKLIHPFSKYHGYRYEYQLTEFLLYSNEYNQIEIFFEIPCMSLTPKVLIPLDKMIQKYAWEMPDVENKRFYINPKVYMVYLISNAIFRKKMFEKKERIWIIRNKQNLEDKQTYEMLCKVFFKFTDTLIDKINKEQFDDVYKSYITFCSY